MLPELFDEIYETFCELMKEVNEDTSERLVDTFLQSAKREMMTKYPNEELLISIAKYKWAVENKIPMRIYVHTCALCSTYLNNEWEDETNDDGDALRCKGCPIQDYLFDEGGGLYERCNGTPLDLFTETEEEHMDVLEDELSFLIEVYNFFNE
jgi:hypothetical protein